MFEILEEITALLLENFDKYKCSNYKLDLKIKVNKQFTSFVYSFEWQWTRKGTISEQFSYIQFTQISLENFFSFFSMTVDDFGEGHRISMLKFHLAVLACMLKLFFMEDLLCRSLDGRWLVQSFILTVFDLGIKGTDKRFHMKILIFFLRLYLTLSSYFDR